MTQILKGTSKIFIIITILFVAGCSKVEKTDNTGRSKAYNFAMMDLNGKMYHLSDFKGKVVILDFWDTWCPPCKAEIPHFIELNNEYKDKDFVMIGAAGARYGKEAVRQFVQERKMNYLNLIANEEAFRGYGDISSIPTTFVIDQNGMIYKKYVGYKPKEVFEQDIKDLIK